MGGGVGGRGGWGAIGRVKQALKHKWQCCAFSRRPRLAQLTGEARSAIRISLGPRAALLMLLRGHKGHEMHPRGLTASEKATCKSRPGHLVSSTGCFWIVHECEFCLH